jgi:alkanesulfonate monooxygenase SsuD/methylene tetrahydromethanopterin reductase-like flavin-dependent oxidoreductase (luciferase family)
VKARAVVIHELAHARAALAAAAEFGVPVALWSAPGAAAYAGVGWFDAVMRAAGRGVPPASFICVLDCDDRADLVQAAWRQGLTHVCFRGSNAVATRLADIARHHSATLHRKMPHALDLLYCDDPLAACRSWLAADRPTAE